MAKYFRQNASYSEIISDGGEDGEASEKAKVNHGNTRLPFGLCERYGIRLPNKATPRDAWNALKGIGITPEKVYASLEKKSEGSGKQLQKEGNESLSIKTSDSVNQSTSTSHMSEQAKVHFNNFQARTSGKHMLHEEALICSPSGDIVLEKRGKERRVSFTMREAQSMQGCDLIHNHPSHFSVLSPADADSSYDKAKSCTMCDLDGNRMTIVYNDDISVQDRKRFYFAYERAFYEAQKVAMNEFNNRMDEFRESLYPDVKRKTKYYQDYKFFQEVVQREIMNWAAQNAQNYKVEIYYEKH